MLASTQARMRAAVHALAARLIEDVKSPESSQRRGDRSQQLFPNGFVSDIRLLGFRFSLFGHTRCGRHFRGREAAALTHQPTATAGGWQKEKVHRDQFRCAPLTGVPHSHACAGELSADDREPHTPAIAGNGPGCRRDGRVLKPQFLQASCRAQDIALSPGTSREDATLRLSFKPGRSRRPHKIGDRRDREDADSGIKAYTSTIHVNTAMRLAPHLQQFPGGLSSALVHRAGWNQPEDSGQG